MPARLEYEITGSVSGLASAASQATGILNSLQNTANNLQIKLFSAETVSDINGIGGALTVVNNKIQEYLKNAIQGSQAFKDQQAQNALDTLANKLTVLNGNVDIFGQSVKNSQAQINAYQSAINSLLSAGLSPFDDKIKSLKGSIDSLNQSIEQQKAAQIPPPVSPRTLGLIEQAEKEVRDLGVALREATSANEINALNQRLNATTQNLRDLRNIGNTVNQTVTATGRAAQVGSRGINSFNLELGRIVQDAPFAANNFGAIGNNLTRLPEVFSGYRAGLVATLEAQGKVASSANLLREGFKGLFTGLSGLSLGLSLAVTAYTFYQQHQQAAAREATNQVNALQKQKQALDDYIATLNESSKAAAAAANNYGEQRNKLDVLSAVLLKNKDAIFQNKSAFDELKSSFPQYFTGITQAQIGTEAFTKAVDKAKASLKDLALANASVKLANDAATSQIQNQIASRAAADKAVTVAKQILALRQKIATTPAISVGVGGASGQGEARALENLENQYASLAKQSVDFAGAADKASKELENFNNLTAKYGTTASESVGRIKSLQNAIESLSKERESLGDAKGLNADQLARLDVINKTIKADQDEIAKLEGKEKAQKSHNRALNQELSIRQQIANILAKDQNSANLSGLSDYGASVQKIVSDYVDLNRQLTQAAEKLDALEKKYRAQKGGITPAQSTGLAVDRSAINRGRGQLALSEAKKLTDARIAEEKRYQSEVERINNEYGVKAQESRNAELSAIDAKADKEIEDARAKNRTLIAITEDYVARLQQAGSDPKAIAAATEVYNAEVKAAQETNQIILTIENGRVVAKQAINDKYLVKEKQLQDSIQSLNEGALAELNDKETNRTAKIVAEWDKRKVAAARYFDELRKISPENTGAIDAQQKQLNNLFDAVKFRQVSEQLSQIFASAMQTGISSFANSFYTAITTLGEQRSAIDLKYNLQLQQASDDTTRAQIENLRKLEQSATTSFGAIFSNLTQSLFQSFNKSIFDSVLKRLTENLGTTLISPGADLAANVKGAGVDFSTTVKEAGLSLATNIRGALGLGLSGGTGQNIAKGIQQATDAFNFQTTGAAAALSTTLSVAGFDFSKNVGKSAEGISKSAAGLASAASLAGGLISGLTPKTSAVGQGVGGLLSGAGTGALIGSAIPGIGTVVGGVVGGVIGAIGGIFGAGKAKKQEELQRQQLEEQKKQTEYLRQQNLAYTSSIIGRVTAEGTVTKVDIDAFGKLTAVVSGKDLQFILDRNSKSRT